MKKLIFWVGMLVVGITYAQDDANHGGFREGDKFASGSIGYSTVSSISNLKTKSFNVTPRVGYFINDFVALGVSLGYSFEKAENEDTHNVTMRNESMTGGVFGRYYLLPGNDFSFFGELGVGFGTIKNKINNRRFNGVNASFTPGLSYFVSEHFALEASFGLINYDSVKQNTDSADSQKSFKVGVDLENINLALIYKF